MSATKVTKSSDIREQRKGGTRFAQNIVAEALTILVIVIFGIASSILIVRGLPQVPFYEFYIYIVVFTWINVLIPVGILGIDTALMKHVPEFVTQHRSLTRLIGWVIFIAIASSVGIIVSVNLVLLGLPLNFVVADYAVPFLQLALLTLPFTILSVILQGFFRGMQEMRYCTITMGLYHSLYFVGLALLFITQMMTLYGVIVLNIFASVITIFVEMGILWNLLRGHNVHVQRIKVATSHRPIIATAVQGLLLALLATVFLNIPLLIANVFRSSDVILGGLGLALSVAIYIQRGQAAPFRVLLPRTAGEMAQNGWEAIEGYMSRAWKLGLLFNGFITVIVVFYAAPSLVVLFAELGLVAVPFLVLMAGSFLIYPLAAMLMDTLIGLGNIRVVLATYAAWTSVATAVLWFLCPIGRELVVALIWLVGIPFLLLLTLVFFRRTGIQMSIGFIPRSVGVLIGVAVLAFTFLSFGWMIITLWGLVGVMAWLWQVLILLTSIPLSILYLWGLIKSGALDPADILALTRMSAVLYPLSKPIVWLIEHME